jgi:AcrR family transcriptional regulator
MRESGTASRLLEITAEMLVNQGYSAVSIAELATRARCSTATIYEMFETKEQLFREALLYLQQREPGPVLCSNGPDDQAFIAILDYSVARIAFLSSARMRGMLLASLPWAERTREEMRILFRERDQAGRLSEAIVAAMRAGHLHAVPDVEATAYCLLAAMSFEPLMMNLYRFEPVDTIALLRTVLAPFLTVTGVALFEDWERQHGVNDIGTPPIRWTYLKAIW